MKRRNSIVRNRTRVARLRRERQRRWQASDHGKYSRARANALARGVEWLFDEKTWLKVWKDSGHFDERGRVAGKYQMARKGDCGPYAEWNVVIVRMQSNAAANALLCGFCTLIHDEELRNEVRSIL